MLIRILDEEKYTDPERLELIRLWLRSMPGATPFVFDLMGQDIRNYALRLHTLGVYRLLLAHGLPPVSDKDIPKRHKREAAYWNAYAEELQKSLQKQVEIRLHRSGEDETTLLLKLSVRRQLYRALPHDKTVADLGLSELQYTSIVGQLHATLSVRDSVWAHLARPPKARKPLVLLFAGPTATGKTETATALAKCLKTKSIKVQCESINTLFGMFGPDPGYRDNDAGGVLGPFLAANDSTFAVVVLDEFEKLPEKVQNAFLNIFDTGMYKDVRAGGRMSLRTVDCSNMVFVLTTNALDEEVTKLGPRYSRTLMDASEREKMSKKLLKAFRRSTSDFLTRRLCMVIPFVPFDSESCWVLAHQCFQKLHTECSANHQVTVDVDEQTEEAAARQYHISAGAKSFIRCSNAIYKRLAVRRKRCELGSGGRVHISHGDILKLNPQFSPTTRVTKVGEIKVTALEPVRDDSNVGCVFDL